MYRNEWPIIIQKWLWSTKLGYSYTTLPISTTHRGDSHWTFGCNLISKNPSKIWHPRIHHQGILPTFWSGVEAADWMNQTEPARPVLFPVSGEKGNTVKPLCEHLPLVNTSFYWTVWDPTERFFDRNRPLFYEHLLIVNSERFFFVYPDTDNLCKVNIFPFSSQSNVPSYGFSKRKR